MYKDTRTAWAQEFDARREGWDTINQLKAELKKVTAERDALKSSLAKRDLEQQAKGVQLAQEYLSFNSVSKDTIAIHELIDLEQGLRKQADEVGK
jgi:SMC interacting uncharacterized protein involved in chromosome segregation